MGTTPGVDPQFDELVENVHGQIPHAKPDAIDVRVVDTPRHEPPRTVTTFSQIIPADGSPVKIVAQMPSRRRLVVQLGNAAPAVVVGGPAVTPGTGFLLTQTPLVIEATASLYACVVTPGAASSVTALAELAEG